MLDGGGQPELGDAAGRGSNASGIADLPIPNPVAEPIGEDRVAEVTRSVGARSQPISEPPTHTSWLLASGGGVPLWDCTRACRTMAPRLAEPDVCVAVI